MEENNVADDVVGEFMNGCDLRAAGRQDIRDQFQLREEFEGLQHRFNEMNNRNLDAPPRVSRPQPNFFSGKADEHFRKWLERSFDHFGTGNRWTPLQKSQFIGDYLRGDAWDIYNHLTEEESSDWETLKTSLAEKFITPGSAQMSLNKFFEIEQGGLTVAQFHRALERCIYDSNPDFEGDLLETYDSMLLSKFLKSLTPQLRTLVATSRPTTYKEAVEAAKQLESSQTLLLGYCSPATVSKDPKDTLIEKLISQLAVPTATSQPPSSAPTPIAASVAPQNLEALIQSSLDKAVQKLKPSESKTAEPEPGFSNPNLNAMIQNSVDQAFQKLTSSDSRPSNNNNQNSGNRGNQGQWRGRGLGGRFGVL